ncbi:transposase, partial [Brevibacterium sp. ZH18]|uniref:transposase n=1 Tax=Brevibacterium sp. ZH18 TaxID=2927784 RepID=UPI001F602425
SGFKTASVEELPDAVEVMDPFHVVKLAGDALDDVRRRIQQETTGHRGRAKDPLYRARRTLHTGTDLLTTKQQERIAGLFADSSSIEVEVTWAVYQDIVSAYRTADRNEGKKLLSTVIDTLTTNLPTGLVELKRLGRTLKRRAADVLAFFTRSGTSNGPTEAINGRLEHLRGSALGFRNITHYIARSLLESGGFRPVLHSQLR